MKFTPSLDPETLEYLGAVYSSPQTILEYGTGGSTFLALRSNPETIVIGCETDPVWLARVCMEASRNSLASRFYPFYQDVGRTREWGLPCFEQEPMTCERAALFVNASVDPWLHVRHLGLTPSFVLIDGRFRVGAFIASISMATAPAIILVDDYADRPNYHVVEDILRPTAMFGRSAVFEVRPNGYNPSELMRMLQHMISPY